MIPAAVSKLLDACGVVFTVDHDNRVARIVRDAVGVSL